MGGAQQLAIRGAGLLAGAAVAAAIAAPFGDPAPRGAGLTAEPARIQVSVPPVGELDLDPVGEVLPPTAFPDPGERGGPLVTMRVTNTTGVPLRVALRLVPIAPELSDAVTVRASAAGAVILDGPLRDAADWSQPAGLLPAGQTTSLRIRFRLRDGLRPEDFRGRLDIRQLELDTARPGQPLTPPSDTQQTVPDTPAPKTSGPGATAATPAPAAGQDPATAPTPEPTPAGPIRRAPDDEPLG